MKSQARQARRQAPAIPAPSAAPEQAMTPPPPAARPRPPFWTVPVTGLLFLAWLGYLAYQVVTLPHAPGDGPVVLSRPQFLVSPLDVVAQVDGVGGPVVVKEVLFPSALRQSPLVGRAIAVTNLDQCRPVPRPDNESAPLDFTGPGRYLLALRPTDLGYAAGMTGLPASPAGLMQALTQPPPELDSSLTYEVVPTPASPGFPPGKRSDEVGPPRIYPDIPANRAQYRQIAKPE